MLDRVSQIFPSIFPTQPASLNSTKIAFQKKKHKSTRQPFCREGREYGRYFVNVMITQEPSEVSMLWFLWYAAACGKSKRGQEVDNGGQVTCFPSSTDARLTRLVFDVVRTRNGPTIRSLFSTQSIPLRFRSRKESLLEVPTRSRKNSLNCSTVRHVRPQKE